MVAAWLLCVLPQKLEPTSDRTRTAWHARTVPWIGEAYEAVEQDRFTRRARTASRAACSAAGYSVSTSS